ncbi:Dyp-type peroxidase [Marinobacteraceae bacterium S3BR75-40.1]
MTPSENVDFSDVQALVVRGFGALPHASFLLFRIVAPTKARAGLEQLGRDLTFAHRRPEEWALNLALSHAGLQTLKIREDILQGFSYAFRSGMDTTHKRRILGDEGSSAPEHWAWGGPKTAGVHGVFLLYARDQAVLDERLQILSDQLFPAGLAEVERLETHPLQQAREHFGFRDAIGQPYISEFDPLKRGVDQAVPLGEFLLGYRNGYGRYTQRPLLPLEADPRERLAPDPAGSGQKDLGLNGTYLVFRQLAQDVAAFWRYMEAHSGREGGGVAGAVRLASRMVGRWPSGTPLVLAPREDDPEITEPDAFLYHDLDAPGYRCPLGAHIRRTNPRDALEPEPGTAKSLAFSHRHRILRRGRIYGKPFHDNFRPEDFLQHLESPDPTPERGLHFICLSANIQRQFEFVQHTWANNPTFNGLYNDPDPLVGPRMAHGKLRDQFTQQAEPVRCRYRGLPEFVRTRGGGYFFLPSRRALAYLTSPEA